jgi:hypothetical protein
MYTIKPQRITQLLREITLRFASDGYRINGWQGPDVYNSLIGRPQIGWIVVETRRSQLTVRVWPGLGSGGVTGKPDVEKRQLVAELQRFCRAKRKRALRGRNHAEGYRGWAHRDDERGRESSFLRRPTSIGSKDPMP